MMNTETVHNSGDTGVNYDNPWKRLIFMIFFAIIFNIVEVIVFLVVIVQFISKVSTGKVFDRLRVFSHELGTYIQQIIEFITYCQDEKPYPFNAWPKSSKTTKWPF